MLLSGVKSSIYARVEEASGCSLYCACIASGGNTIQSDRDRKLIGTTSTIIASRGHSGACCDWIVLDYGTIMFCNSVVIEFIFMLRSFSWQLAADVAVAGLIGHTVTSSDSFNETALLG